MWNQWLAQLERDYSFTPDDQQLRQVFAYFSQTNRSFMSHESYNAARRWATRNGVFPPNMLTDDERMCEMVEQNDSRSYESKMDLAREFSSLRRR